jgi:hypothetical protein
MCCKLPNKILKPNPIRNIKVRSRFAVQSYYAPDLCAVNMGRKKDLTTLGKASIVRLLASGNWEVCVSYAQKLKRDHRTIQICLDARQLFQVRKKVRRTPLATSKEVFQACGLPLLTVRRFKHWLQ